MDRVIAGAGLVVTAMLREGEPTARATMQALQRAQRQAVQSCQAAQAKASNEAARMHEPHRMDMDWTPDDFNPPSTQASESSQGVDMGAQREDISELGSTTTDSGATVMDREGSHIDGGQQATTKDGEFGGDQRVVAVGQERRVPAGQAERVLHFGGLFAGLAVGTATELITRGFGAVGLGSSEASSSLVLNPNNAARLSETLCRMRGAALKLGQMLSIQDESVLPPEIKQVFDRVREGADVMPEYQMSQVLTTAWGDDWRDRIQSFDDKPAAAASIGQVHRAVLHDGRQAMIKVQYPGVADSVQSDLNNLKMLAQYTRIIPRGLFADNIVRVAAKELAMECDYRIEADNQQRFRELAMTLPGVSVPSVITELSTERVLATEYARGQSIEHCKTLPQEMKDSLGTLLLQLCIKELFEWRMMQTDPNWGNFLYDPSTGVTSLIDFGACLDLSKEFCDDYVNMIHACIVKDRQRVADTSVRMGFLTGDESDIMVNAHVDAAILIGKPFVTPGPFDFLAPENNITEEVNQLSRVMLKNRLTPPPDEVYSLHRKLAGTFLTCVQLGAYVDCNKVFMEAWEKHS